MTPPNSDPAASRNATPTGDATATSNATARDNATATGDAAVGDAASGDAAVGDAAAMGDAMVDDPIEAYLDQLLVSLPGSPRQVRHTLAEVEAHLHDAAEQHRRDGLTDPAARRAAVASMGPVAVVADRVSLRLRLTPARRRRIVLGGLLVGGSAGIAVGAAAVIGYLLRAVWGARAIATPFPAGSYTAADCSRWMSYHPGARDCVTAMVADHADDFLLNATACGVLGLVLLTGYALLRRRWTSREVTAAFPRGSEDVLGAALAGLTAVAFLGQGIDAELVTYGNGAGQPFALAAAAAATTALFAVRAHRALTTRSPLAAATATATA